MTQESWRRWVRRWLDPALTLAVLLMGLHDLHGGPGHFIAGSVSANAVFLVLATIPLVWRRRRPLTVVAVVTAVVVVWVTVLYMYRDPPFTPGALLMLCAYTVAAWVASPWPAVAFAAALCVEEALGGRSVEGNITFWVMMALSLGFGRMVQRQRALTEALAVRTRSLEAAQKETARLATALERTRIARELHDVVTHKVTAMVIQAGVEGRMLGEQTGSTQEVLATIEETGRDTLVELRRLLDVLRRDNERNDLAPTPSLDRLDDLVEEVRRAGLPVQLQVEGARVPLSAGLELSAYRIVQEALTNCLRHAGAGHVQVAIRYRHRALELEVRDDGHGPIGPTTVGHGLTGMRERAAMHGGTLRVGPGQRGGYTVHAELPLGAS
jgi:signal transduction histidine kinase